jgi:hypothetical protein
MVTCREVLPDLPILSEAGESGEKQQNISEKWQKSASPQRKARASE